MPEVSPNGNPIANLPPWRVKAVLNGTQKKAVVSWRKFIPVDSANFRITEDSDLRAFEDGQVVELG